MVLAGPRASPLTRTGVPLAMLFCPMSESSLPVFHVIGFSGHRVVANPAAVQRVIGETLAALRAERVGEWLALASVAAGSDQIFVEEARRLGLSWHAILPLPKAEFERDFTAEDWVAVERLLVDAELVRVITENGSRDDAYLDCGMETVNGADVLMAVWDGLPAKGKGGTADVVAYARALGKPIILIDSTTGEVRREHWERFGRADRPPHGTGAGAGGARVAFADEFYGVALVCRESRLAGALWSRLSWGELIGRSAFGRGSTRSGRRGQASTAARAK